MENRVTNCRMIPLSEDYADFIVNFSGSDKMVIETFGGECYQRISASYGTLYASILQSYPLSIQDYGYNAIPALYGLMERSITINQANKETALENSGILRLQNQPAVRLRGQGCIMAFIDTGINIDDDEFRFSNGETRILRLWDMTDNSGTPPDGILFGSEYTSDMINKILSESNSNTKSEIDTNAASDIKSASDTNVTSNDRLRSATVYPGHDDLNHGNILAKIGAGNTGAAPESYIVVVKLKQAKQYLREYYYLDKGVPAYQENDIMLAVNYVRNVALNLQIPVSLCLALGTNSRGHDGSSALSYIIDSFSGSTGENVCISGGDEGNKQLHASGVVQSENESVDIELRIDERQNGIIINIWGDRQQIFSVGIMSPTGESIPKVPARIGKSEKYRLIFDNTTVTIEYDLVESNSSDELIIIRLDKPTPGIWTIKVYGNNLVSGRFNAYIPISQFISENTYFLEPDPNITITDPSYARKAITTTLFDPINNALYINNGRGYGRDGSIKPDIASPVSAAVTAGAAALFLTWGVVNENDVSLKSSDVKSYLIRGADRNPDINYPNREQGWGYLNVYGAFERLRGL